MEVNVKKMEAIREYREGRPGSRNYAKEEPAETLELRIWLDGDEYPRACPMIHSTMQISEFRDMLYGRVPWRNKIAFDDGNYVIANAGPWGIKLWRYESGKAIIEYITFPGKVLAEWLDWTYVSRYNKSDRVVFTEKQFAQIKRDYRSRAKLVLNDESRRRMNEYLFCETEYGSHPEITEENKREFIDGVRGMMRIARNNSDGDVVEVHLSNDWHPLSFSWVIYRRVKHSCGRCEKIVKVMNGGLIAHKYEKDGERTICLSTHT